jgi:cell wall-associated NlpC family hydrolase
MADGGVAKHAGIMATAESFIHSQEGLGTVEAELIKWWRRRLVAAYAFPEVK